MSEIISRIHDGGGHHGAVLLAERDLSKVPTKKELAVLRLVAAGYTSDEVAETLDKHHGTIKNQLVTIKRRLGASNSIASVVLALKHGYIKLAEIEVRE